MKRQVIGGEFQIGTVDAMAVARGVEDGESVYKGGYSLGRTALYVILKHLRDERGIRELYLPDYLCASVVEVVDRLRIEKRFYHVGMDLCPDEGAFEDGLEKTRAVLIVDYFGMTDVAKTRKRVRATNPRAVIIEDDVQSYYRFLEGSDADFAFTSLRKWFGVPDGAPIRARDEDEMETFPKYPCGAPYVGRKFAGNLLKSYRGCVEDDVILGLLDDGERLMEEDYLYQCADTSTRLMSRIDTVEVAARRKRNAAVLHEGLLKKEIRHVYEKDAVPLFVPIFPKGDRDEVRKRMFAQNIFPPVHWPTGKDARERNTLYEGELSLICDQRYDEGDMERMLELL